MKVRTHRRRRIRFLRSLALGFAVAATAAPSALADPKDGYPPPRGELVDGWALNLIGKGSDRPAGEYVDGWVKGVVADASDRVVGTGTREYVPFVTDFPKVAPVARTDVPQYGLPRPTASDYARYLVPAQTAAPTGFEWTDAGIGAGIGIAALLALMGLGLLGRNRIRAAHP